MKTTTTAARKDPMHAETKDCCHVYSFCKNFKAYNHEPAKLTKPTVTKAEPVFQPTKENWLENQYNGRLYLYL